MPDQKISELTSGSLTTGDWIPSERNAAANYRLNLREVISGAFTGMPLNAQSVNVTNNLIVGGYISSDQIIQANAGLSVADEISFGVGGSPNQRQMYWQSSPPSTSWTAKTGSLFFNFNGQPGATLYIKETGVDGNGWNPVITNLATGTNLAIGQSAAASFEGSALNIGNVFIGANVAPQWEAGAGNVILGAHAGGDSAGANYAIVIGQDAGTNKTVGHNCILVGPESSVSNDGDTHSIVIGCSEAQGSGSYTTVLGDNFTTDTYIKGTVHVPSLEAYNSSGAATIVSNLVNYAGSRNICVTDDFVTNSTTSTLIGQLGWAAAGTSSLRGTESGHPGIFRIGSLSAAAAGMYLNSASTEMTSYDGTTLEFVFRLPDPIISGAASVGLSYASSDALSVGGRVLRFDSGLSPNWRILHASNSGHSAYVDTTKAAVANDWVRARLNFSGVYTICTIATTSSPTEVTVTGAGTFIPHELGQSPQIYIKGSNSSLPRYLDVDFFGMYGLSSTNRL